MRLKIPFCCKECFKQNYELIKVFNTNSRDPMISILTNLFSCFRLEMMDDISLSFSKILSKISNISIPSRKRSHIPPCKSRNIIDSRVPSGRGHEILPCMEKCHKRCLVSSSLILLIVCHHLGLGAIFGLHWRYQQANVFPNDGIRFRLPQSRAMKSPAPADSKWPCGP